MREHNLAQINKDVGIPGCINKKSNIWNDVIVVYKGLWETFDETVIKGAIKKVNNSLDIVAKTHFMAVYLYQALKPDSPYHDLPEETLHRNGIYKKKEFADSYKKTTVT